MLKLEYHMMTDLVLMGPLTVTLIFLLKSSNADRAVRISSIHQTIVFAVVN
jgi:hypothetical protein